MKFEEALKHLREGKKIRRSCWGKREYICYRDNHLEKNCNKYTYYLLDNVLKDDWELYEEPILTESEKEYLSAVVRPFRYNVRYIEKCLVGGEEFIIIGLKTTKNTIVFPLFDEDIIYKGMEIDKEYTLKELGL